MSDHEHAFNHRTAITRAIVHSVDDTGVVQTAVVQSGDGLNRADVEVHQPFGLASCPPANGGTVILLSNGADPSDLIALAAACNFGRLGGLQPGETAIYAADGTRVHLQAGGKIVIAAATSVEIQAPHCTLVCSGGITLDGPVTVTGATTITGNATLNGNLQVNGNINATGTITP